MKRRSTNKRSKLKRAAWAMTLMGTLLTFACFTRIDTDPYFTQTYYARSMESLRGVDADPDLTPKKLLAGAARISITPKLDGARSPLSDLPLAGYGARKGAPALDVLDEVHVRVLWLQDDHRSSVIISLDMLIPPPEMIVTFRKKVQQRIGIPSEAVYWGASHTHSGPGGDGVRDGCLRLSPGLTSPLSIHGSWIGFSRAWRKLVQNFAPSPSPPRPAKPKICAAIDSSAPKDKSMNAFIPCFSNLKTKSLPPWGFFQPTPPLSAPPPKPIAGIIPVIGLKGWKKPLAVSPCFWPEEWVATQQRREKRSMRVPWHRTSPLVGRDGLVTTSVSVETGHGMVTDVAHVVLMRRGEGESSRWRISSARPVSSRGGGGNLHRSVAFAVEEADRMDGELTDAT